MQGRWTHRSAVSINFMLPEMISPSDIDPIIPYLPSEPISINQLDRLDVMNMSVPREVGAEVLEKMRRFHQSANDIMRTYAGRLSNAFKIMAHPTKTSQATLQEIAVRVLQINRPSNLTSAMLWAVYRMISKNAYITAQHFQYRASQRFDIISKKDAEILEEVRGWLRQYQEKLIANVARMPSTPEFAGPYQKSNPFPSFIFKAQAAIKASRKLRAVTPSGILGPSSLKSNEIYEDGKTQSVAFNSRERKIIDFIRQWSIPPQVPVHSIVGSIGPMILRFIGMYDGFKLERSIGFLLLQELGCIAPWAHHADRGLVLTLSGLDTRYLQDPTQESGGEPIADLETSDQMREFRKDWKDMAVFAIDSAQTVDVDDGLSLETVAGDPSTYWVHIHVANPSAFLAPDAEICRSAARMMESLYFPDKSYPMFPNSVTQKHFSLDQNRPCITFSAKITKEGEVVQSKISHGVVRNVKRITPEKLQQLLNRNTPPTRTMTLGGEMSQPTQKTFTQPLEVSDIEILRKLCEIAIARCRKRQFQAAFNYVQTPDVDIKVLCPTGSALSTRFFGESTKLWIGDPSMSLKTIARINEQSLQEDSIGDVVGNYMILAGEVAASWCSQRNIPIAYLGFLRSPEPVMPPEQYKRDFIDPATAKGGIPPYHLFKRYMELLGKSIYSTRPLKHIPLGVAEYCRVTSPLRRYPDLMTHWQIEAAIFHEAQSSTSLVGTTSDCYLPFSRSRVESVLPRMRQHETSIRTSKTFARRHWQLQWLARAFYFQEAPLPETFELYVYTSLQANYIKGNKAWINGLSISCFIRLNEITKQEGGVAVGDWWEGRIVNINCYHQQVLMEPIRLLKKTQWQDHAW